MSDMLNHRLQRIHRQITLGEMEKRDKKIEAFNLSLMRKSKDGEKSMKRSFYMSPFLKTQGNESKHKAKSFFEKKHKKTAISKDDMTTIKNILSQKNAPFSRNLKQKNSSLSIFHPKTEFCSTKYTKQMVITEPSGPQIKKKRKIIIYPQFQKKLQQKTSQGQFKMKEEDEDTYLDVKFKTPFDSHEKEIKENREIFQRKIFVNKKSRNTIDKNNLTLMEKQKINSFCKIDEERDYGNFQKKSFPSLTFMMNKAQNQNAKKEVLFKEKNCLNNSCLSNESLKILELNSKIIEKKSLNLNTSKIMRTMKSIRTLGSGKSRKQFGTKTYFEGKKIAQIGKGKFGTVWKLKLKEENQIIAVKKIETCQGSKESQIMSQLCGHPFICQLHDSFRTIKHSGYEIQLFMEYYSGKDLLFNLEREGTFNFPKVKIYAYQMLRGLHYIHSQGFIHQDIKCENIFTQGNSLVIGDFGCAKLKQQAQKGSTYLGIRSNRAPELVCGNKCYNEKVDVWAVGCVICQMITGFPLFQSSNSLDLFIEMIRILGTPSKQQFEEVNNGNKRIVFENLPQQVRRKSWNETLQQQLLCPNLIDLLNKLFEFKVSQRYSAISALMHPYFDQLRNQKRFQQLRSEYKIGDNLFHFWQNQISCDQKSKLVPDWSCQFNEECF